MRKAFDLKPLNVGDIFGRSFSLMFQALVPILTWVILTWTIPAIGFRLMLSQLFPAAESGDSGTLSDVAILCFDLLLGFTVMGAGVSYIAARCYVGARVTLLEVARAVFSRFANVLLCGVSLVAAVISIPVITYLAIDAQPGATGPEIVLLLMTMGMAWGVGVLVVFGLYGLAPICVMLDDESTSGAWRKSLELTRGMRLRLVGILVSVVLLFGLPGTYGLMSFPGFLAHIALDETQFVFAATVLQLLWQSFLVPAIFLTCVVYSFDMRCRNNGYDIAVMAWNFGIEEGELSLYWLNPHRGYDPAGKAAERPKRVAYPSRSRPRRVP
jgi:hypothetical protein